jgi:N-acetylneuraminic acid mutarotase
MNLKENALSWKKINITDGWTPGARQGHSAVVINRSMYVFGGIEGAKRTNSTLAFNLSSSQWQRLKVSGNVPEPRCYAASWTIGPNIYIQGGEAEGKSATFDHTRLDDRTGRPTEISHNTALTQSDVFAMVNDGVRIKRRCLDDLCFFNTQTNQWKSIATVLAPLARKGHTVTRISSTGAPILVMLGGAPSGSAKVCSMAPYVLTADEQILHANRAMWTTPDLDCDHLPIARYGHSCTPSFTPEPHLIIFGGMADDGELLDDMQVEPYQ